MYPPLEWDTFPWTEVFVDLSPLPGMRQFPLIVHHGKQPDYDTCIRISTAASLKEMIAPGALVLFSPLLTGLLFGKHAVAGLLVGILVSGVQLAISMSNTGGAWDNAKKYIEKGGLPGHPKGSATHKNAVTGDTVGDPLRSRNLIPSPFYPSARIPEGVKFTSPARIPRWCVSRPWGAMWAEGGGGVQIGMG